MIVQDSRIQLKYTTITGVEPTIPLTDDHTDGTWLPTDLYVGEVFLNAADNLAWWRSENGLVPFGATGSTGPFIGDFVPASIGGTYGGPVYGPEFNADLIVGNEIQGGTGTFTGPVTATTFYGDGSNLTGISASWDGGVVPNPSNFQDDVTFDTNINVDIINSVGPEIDINAPINVGGTGNFVGPVIASTFYGDGSNLTGITGTTDTYTEAAYLDGNILKFDRNDLVNAYSVDLGGLVSSPIDTLSWNPATNELNITFMDTSVITLPITEFTDLTVYGNLTADAFVGDGSQLTNLPISAGPTGPTGPTGATGADGARAIMNLSYTSSGLTLGTGTKTLPISTPIVNLGWQQGTRVRIWNDATHYMEGQITTVITNPQTTNINVNVDYVVGTGTFGAWYVGIAGDTGSGSGGSQTLSQTLVLGNSSGANDIIMEQDQAINHGGSTGTDLGVVFTYDVDSTDIKQIHVRGESNGGYGIVGIDNTIGTDTKVRLQTRNSDNSGADVFMTQGDNNITLSTNDGSDFTIFDITPGRIVVNNPSTFYGFPGIEYDDNYSATFNNRSLVDKEYVDGVGASAGALQNLQETLQTGNTSGNNNIVFNNYYGLENSTGEADIKMNEYEINTVHQKYIGSSTTDYRRGLFQGSGHNGVASITGDEYNVTTDLYRAGSIDVQTLYARMFYQETQISTGSGYQSYMTIYKDSILVGSNYNSSLQNTNFEGLVYAHDYSADYTNRSLVDKEYVDNAVAGGGGGSQTLAQTLALGNSAGTYDINMNNNDITNIATISANSGPAVQMINMTNAVNMMLMYNS